VYSCLHVHVLMKRSLIKIRHNNLSDRRVGIRKAARARYPCAPGGGLRTVAGWLRTRVKVARVVGASACGRHDSTQNGQHIKTLSNVLESVCSCLRPLPAPLGAGPLALTTSPRGSKKRSS
jgi:hypothetical protein